ncbi:MAG TPA: hypothetical protein VMG80_02635 [Solirubrobacteraceae bacterium]|nr:hypothetical protein [Solirubrobacteraceae bacterium]
MPRVIVTTDPFPLSADAPVWLDEHVQSVHLSTEHAAAQFVERLAWAISDAEEADGEGAGHRPRISRRRRRSSSATRPRSQLRIRA